MAFSVNCPECGTSLEVEDDHREWTVRCPSCRHEFRPSEATFALAPRDDDDDAPKPPRKKKRRRVIDDDDDFDDDPADAAADISGPATALKVVGWLGVVLSMISFGLWCVLLAMAMAMPPGQKAQNGQQGRDEILMQAAIYIPQSIVGCGVSIVMIVGAGRMGRLENYGWAQAAAIIGMVPCISPCCLLGLPFGIWALTVLNKPHVQAAFKRNARGRRSSDEED